MDIVCTIWYTSIERKEVRKMAVLSRVAHKNDRLDLRIHREQKKFLMRAAALRRMKLSSFVLDSAFKRAEEIVAERTHFALPKKQWETFCQALDRPARSMPQLKNLFSKKTVFDE